MTKNIAYVDQPCERCGSKKYVSRTWTEAIPTFNGTVDVEYSQIVCSNKACQEEFEENLEKENKKRDVLRQQKEEKDKIRKENSLKNAKDALEAKNKK